MKRVSGLWQRVIDPDNLRLADEKARRGKLKSYGVRVHDRNREANIIRLHEALLTKTFKTSPYTVFTIYEPKERIIFRLPYYPDRIVHHAIMNILEPIFVKVFTHNTYSCIKKRGIEGCARATEKAIASFDGQPLYCLKIDIRKFYPSIDHEVLKGLVRRVIKDADLLWLMDGIIDSAQGLPIGNYLSQYLANLCLAFFMHWVNEVLPLLIGARIVSLEYADDIVFLSDDKEALHRALPLIREYLSERLHLTVKGNWQVFPIADNRYDRSGRALDYVGYKFYRHQKLMRKCIKKNFCRAVARLNRQEPVPSFEAYRQAIAPWLGWAKHSDSRNLLRTIIISKYYGTLRQYALETRGSRQRQLSLPLRHSGTGGRKRLSVRNRRTARTHAMGVRGGDGVGTAHG